MFELAAWAGNIGLLGGTVIALGSFFGGTFFRAWIEKSIQAKFDRDIEEIRSQMRQSDRRVEAIGRSALSAAAHTNDILAKRKIEATEKVWAAVLELRRQKLAAYFAQRVKMEEAVNLAATKSAEGQSVRDFAEQVWKAGNLGDVVPITPPDLERLYVAPMAWAIFSVYRIVLTVPLVQFAAMRSGIGTSPFTNIVELMNSVKATLPHQSDFIDNHGLTALSFLVDELEEKLFSALRTSLDNPNTDLENVSRAAKIMSAVEKSYVGTDADVPAEIQQNYAPQA